MPFTPTRPHLAYQTAGTDGPPVLLIMGFTMPGAVWQDQLDDLARDHRVCAFDHRGVGDSNADGRLWTMRQLAGDALRVLDALGWRRAHVVGVSMGGMIAQELALLAPERLRSLSLIATHGGGLAWLPPAAGLRRLLEANLTTGQWRRRALEHLLFPETFLRDVDPTRLRERMRRIVPRPHRRAVLGQLSAILRHRAMGRLSLLRVPTLGVKAGRDILIAPRHSEALAARIPGAELVRFDDAGHGVIFQHATELDERLRRHFTAADALSRAAENPRVHA